jgi:hypothetical protein
MEELINTFEGLTLFEKIGGSAMGIVFFTPIFLMFITASIPKKKFNQRE